MPTPKRDLQRSLTHKFGFQKVAGSQHEAMSLLVGGKKVATVRFSRSRKDISDAVLTMIARELRVNLSYLKQMHECTKSSQDYLSLLRETGYLE